MSHEKREREKREKYNKSIRDRDFGDFLKKSPKAPPQNWLKTSVSKAGSTSPMGIPVASLTPYNKKIKKFLLVEFL